MKRYTKEQLSRILGEHAAGQLRKGGLWAWGRYRWPMACANQVAYNEPSTIDAAALNRHQAVRFDNLYDCDLSPEKLLALLEA